MILKSRFNQTNQLQFNCQFIQNNSGYDFNHNGELLFNNGKSIKTPVIWFGLSVIESLDFQLKVFKECHVEAFLSNTYDLLVQDKKAIRHRLIQELTRMGLHHKMDSGGFQLMKALNNKKKMKIKLTPELAYRLQKSYLPEIAVQLDFPLHPGSSYSKQKNLIDKTIDNFMKLVEIFDDNNIIIMPVCHGYNNNMLEYSISEFEDIIGNINVIGIGSLVPMVKSITNTHKIGGKERFIQNLIYIRKRLPNSFIHAFGIGGTMAYLAFFCGIDSIDSNGWIQKSGYGVIQLPGIPDRFIIPQKSHNRPYLKIDRYNKRLKKTINEREVFMKCKCPACAEFNPFFNKQSKTELWNKKKLLFNGYSQKSRLLRSIHNVYTLQSELIKIRDNISKGKLNNFIEKRLTMSNYYKLFKFASKLK